MTTRDGRTKTLYELMSLNVDSHLETGYEMLEHKEIEEVPYKPAIERTVVNREEARLIRRLREEKKYKEL